MNRHLRSLFIAVVLIAIIIFAIPSVGSTIRSVQAADQKTVNQGGDSTDEPQPTDVPAQATDAPPEQPTDAPTDVPSEQPTDVPTLAPTDVPTEQATDVEVTEQPTDAPTAVDATEDATAEPGVTATDTPVDAEVTATATPEETLAPEETLSPEVTETPTVIAPTFSVITSCKETGITFVITNVGANMESPSHFVLTLDDAANAAAPQAPSNLPSSLFPTEFSLHAGESTEVAAGFGQPQMVLEGVLFQADAPCVPPASPVLTVSAICTFEKGVTFTITNSGGAMPAEQGFIIAVSNGGDPIGGSFQLGTTESTSFDAGYGQPIFNSGDVTGTIDTPCAAPIAISGSVWNDADGNGARDAAETGIAGVSVNLIDASGAVNSSVTTADGSYHFGQLHIGSYTVKVDSSTLSTDYVLSYPTDSVVTVDAQGTNTSADFGFSAKPTASVTGTVWLETSNYGVRDANEMGIGGVVVDLVDHNGVVVAVAPVDATTGTYVFTAVLAGEYTVRLEQATLFTPNGVTYNSDSTFDYETHIRLTTDQALAHIDFGLVGTY